MATVRQGNKSALLIVDVQVGVMRNAWNASQIVDNIVVALNRARSEGVPVIWVQHADEELPEGSAPWQWVPELVPIDGEARINKHYNSSFEQTSLEAELARLGVTRVVLAGAATNWCIRATAYAALERGYDLTLVADAHTTESTQLENGATIEAAAVVEELNIAIRWLAYPGRRNAVESAKQVGFTLFDGTQ